MKKSYALIGTSFSGADIISRDLLERYRFLIVKKIEPDQICLVKWMDSGMSYDLYLTTHPFFYVEKLYSYLYDNNIIPVFFLPLQLFIEDEIVSCLADFVDEFNDREFYISINTPVTFQGEIGNMDRLFYLIREFRSRIIFTGIWFQNYKNPDCVIKDMFEQLNRLKQIYSDGLES